MNVLIPTALLDKLMDDYNAIYKTQTETHKIYKYHLTVIKIPLQPDMVEFDLLEAIAIDQMSLGMWEFDYWVGENVVIQTSKV